MVYILLLTLTVTVVTCEHSFSKLKLIKNFLRSTMSQERLSDLAVLSIENHHAKSWIRPILLTLLHKRRHENGDCSELKMEYLSVLNTTIVIVCSVAVF